ncbi:ATP-binding protein [Rhizobium ruizarguesonis]|uniref:ATP-dependent nuclease n=1 Tax=Rhizobium ruizarguesonis TaxID=2081791 RepID=UPI001031F1E7|nr:AAA family ATPase [Rhizobium ruizarguesonis]TAU29792.1 ATP-binding protein [Rhizobium ruizarguesonis]TAW19940.1 ATP-binding protein [Rhizobium ruizarguesonis]
MKSVGAFLEREEVELTLSRQPGHPFSILSGAPYLAAPRAMEIRITPDLKVEPASVPTIGLLPDLPIKVTNFWNTNLFHFNAQRYNVGVCEAGHPSRLNSDASNLPAVLMRLAGNSGDIFRELSQHMRDIFPSVKNLSVTGIERTNNLEILIWPTVEQRYREHAVGLNESGTGLSQVLAILTVAMTMERSVVVIDEISSFLHPAAAKALVRILESHYSHHQYLISTHSPEVIAASSPSTVHLVKKDGFKSSVLPINPADIFQLRLVTGELGVSMTDVFASDRIVWVEGPTEETAFPYIIEQTRSLKGSKVGETAPQFTAVIATGDFTAKRARKELVFEIYTRLSSAAATIASSAVFAFDKEELSAEGMADLNRQGKSRVAFLPRRHFECYLLSPSAIKSVLTAELGEEVATTAEIEKMLLTLGGGPKFKAKSKWKNDLSDEEWLAEVDAANLLKQVFNEATSSRLAFSKIRHSFLLLKEIMGSNPTSIKELIGFVHELAELSLDKA